MRSTPKASDRSGVPVGRGSPRLPGRTRRRLSAVLFGGLLALLLLFSPLIGPVPIAANVVGSVLLHQTTGGLYPTFPCGGSGVSPSRCAVLVQIIWDVRLPELLLALFVGAALGLSGATLQGVFRNPLADPYLLGLSSGAALGAAALFVGGFGGSAANVTLPLFAFIGAIATGLVILAAGLSRRATPATLLLTGVALSSFLSAILATLLLFNPLGNLQVSYWLLGGLFGASWSRDGIVLGGALVGGGLLLLYARELNLLQLGPEVAQSLGVDARAARTRLILLASFVTAVAVSFAGIIGFVGLVAPHIVRRLFGVDYRIVLPASAIVGACMLGSAQDLAQLVTAGTEIPVGIPTSFAGFPFFLYLLYRHQRRSAP